MNMRTRFDPGTAMLSGYHPLDGTMEFFARVRSVLKPSDLIVDLGAGRAGWYFEDTCETRRQLRDLRPAVAGIIGIDLDPVVLSNPTTTENRVMVGGVIPLADHSVDAVLADHVLEHVADPPAFMREVDRILKPGGYFFARTPAKYHYVAVIARLVHSKHHVRVLRFTQPRRKPEDVFPTEYRMNTRGAIRRLFRGYEDYTYLYCAEPSYYFGNRLAYACFSALHRILPRPLVSSLFVFLRKPAEAASESLAAAASGRPERAHALPSVRSA